MQNSPFSSIDGENEPSTIKKHSEQVDHAKLNSMLNDRFEIETIKQEQTFFQHRLETIKNDINQM